MFLPDGSPRLGELPVHAVHSQQRVSRSPLESYRGGEASQSINSWLALMQSKRNEVVHEQSASQKQLTLLRSKELEEVESRCKFKVAGKIIPAKAGWCTGHMEGASVPSQPTVQEVALFNSSPRH